MTTAYYRFARGVLGKFVRRFVSVYRHFGLAAFFVVLVEHGVIAARELCRAAERILYLRAVALAVVRALGDRGNIAVAVVAVGELTAVGEFTRFYRRCAVYILELGLVLARFVKYGNI